MYDVETMHLPMHFVDPTLSTSLGTQRGILIGLLPPPEKLFPSVEILEHVLHV